MSKMLWTVTIDCEKGKPLYTIEGVAEEDADFEEGEYYQSKQRAQRTADCLNDAFEYTCKSAGTFARNRKAHPPAQR